MDYLIAFFVMELFFGLLVFLNQTLPSREERKANSLVQTRREFSLEKHKLSLVRRARLAVKQGVFEFAEDLLYQASGLDDRDPVILSSLVRAQLEQKKWHKARVVAERLVKYAPTQENLALLGELLLTMGKLENDPTYHERSIDCYQSILAKYPTDTGSLNDIAENYRALGATQDQLEYLERSIEIDPQQKQVVMQLLELYEHSGQYLAADRLLNIVAPHFPEDLEFMRARLNFLLHRKQYAQMIQLTAGLPPQAYEHLPILRLMGLAAYFNQELDQAITFFQHAIKLPKAQSSDHYNLALVMYAKSLSEDAKLQLQQAIDADAGNPSYHFLMAKVEESLGHDELARTALQRVLSLDPDHFEARKQLKRFGS